MKPENVFEIIHRLGGPIKMAKKLKIHRESVYYFIGNGIPEKYWKAILKADSSITLELLHNINEAFRAQKSK